MSPQYVYMHVHGPIVPLSFPCFFVDGPCRAYVHNVDSLFYYFINKLLDQLSKNKINRKGTYADPIFII